MPDIYEHQVRLKRL